MNESKWISLNDKTKICLTSLVRKYCTDAILGNGSDVIGIRVESKHAPLIRKSISKFLDLEDSDSNTIAVLANDKIKSLIPFVESSKPNRLNNINYSGAQEDVVYCKSMVVFFSSKRNDNVENRIFNHYDMERYELQYYENESGMVYICQHPEEYMITRSSYNGKMYGINRETYQKLYHYAKTIDMKKAKQDSLNMSEFLRNNGIESSERLINLLNARNAKGIIDEEKVNKQILNVVDAMEEVKNDLVLLQYLKIQLKEMGGAQKVLEKFEKSCEELVESEYKTLLM